jgi:hypothetical protein
VGIQELFAAGPTRQERVRTHQKRAWSLFFNGLDRVLRAAEPLFPTALRRRAIERCVGFVTERLNGEDGLGAIYPAMANTVMMFECLGYAKDHSDIRPTMLIARWRAGRSTGCWSFERPRPIASLACLLSGTLRSRRMP